MFSLEEEFGDGIRSGADVHHCVNGEKMKTEGERELMKRMRERVKEEDERELKKRMRERVNEENDRE